MHFLGILDWMDVSFQELVFFQVIVLLYMSEMYGTFGHLIYCLWDLGIELGDTPEFWQQELGKEMQPQWPS
jgi:hypothetical protein